MQQMKPNEPVNGHYFHHEPPQPEEPPRAPRRRKRHRILRGFWNTFAVIGIAATLYVLAKYAVIPLLVLVQGMQ